MKGTWFLRVSLALVIIATTHQAHAQSITLSSANLTVSEGNSGTQQEASVSVSINQDPGDGVQLQVTVLSSSTATTNTNTGSSSCTSPSPAGADWCYTPPFDGATTDFNKITITSSDLTAGASPPSYSKTFKLKIIGDTTVEEDETVKVRFNGADGSGWENIESSIFTLTITDDDTNANDATNALTTVNEVHSAVLPQIAGAVMSQTLNTISNRVNEVTCDTNGTGDVQFHAATRSSLLKRQNDSRSPVVLSGRQAAELMNGATFSLQADGAGGNGAPTLWGQGDWTSLKGSDGKVHWDGGLRALHLGADLCVRDEVMVGAAVSRSIGDLDTESGGVKSPYETSLTVVQPYVAWTMADGAHLWGSVGYGEGEVQLREATTLRQTDMTWRSAAVGGRRILREDAQMIAGGTTRLSVKGWGSTARLRTAKNDGLMALTLNTTRLRVMLEGAHERSLGEERTLTASLEAGMRYDDGDLGRGAGLEVGGGARWRDAAQRLTSELRLRMLVDHEKARDEWGASLLLRHEPQADGSGAAMSLELSRGQSVSHFDWRLASDRPANAASDTHEIHLTAEVSHGVRAPGAGALLSPYAGLRMPESGSGTMRFGIRYRLRDEFRLGLAMESQPGEVAMDGISVQGALNW